MAPAGAAAAAGLLALVGVAGPEQRVPVASAQAAEAHLELVTRHAVQVMAVATAPGGFAYAATDSGLSVLAVPSPSQATNLGTLVVEGAVIDVAAGAPGWAYLAVAPDRLAVVDATDPTAPRLVGSVVVGGTILSVEASGSLVLLALGADGLAVVDVAEAALPRVLGRLPAAPKTRHALPAGRYAYLAERDVFDALLRVVDLSDPSAPRSAGYVTIPGGVDRLAWSGERVVTLGATGRVWTVDVSDPARPRRVAPLDAQRFARSRALAVTGNHALVLADGNGTGWLGVVELSGTRDLALAGSANFLGDGLDLALVGKAALVATGRAGLQVADLSEVAQPQFIGWAGGFFGAVGDLVAWDRHLYVAGRETLATLDVSEPGRIRAVHQLVLHGEPRDIAFRGEGPELLVAGLPAVVQTCAGRNCQSRYEGAGLQRVHLGRPEAPVLVGADSDLDLVAVTSLGEQAFGVVNRSLAGGGTTAGWRIGLAGFELSGLVSAPRARSFAGFDTVRFQIAGPTEVVAFDRYAYVASHDVGLQVLDVRWPDDLRLRAVLNADGLAQSNTLVARGDTLLVGTDNGLRAVDVSDPAQPAVVGRGAETTGIGHVVLADEHLVAVSGNRLLLYDVSTPRAPRLADSLDLGPSPTPSPTVGPCSRADCTTQVPPYGSQPRLAATGRRLFAALPEFGLNELVIRAGPRPTVTGTSEPPTPAATATLAASPSASASPTGDGATATRTSGPTRAPYRVHLPLAWAWRP